MVPFDFEDLICHLVELLHLPISKHLSKVLQVIRLLESSSDCKLLKFLLSLILIMVPDGNMSFPFPFFLLFSMVGEGIGHCLFRDVLVRRLGDCEL